MKRFAFQPSRWLTGLVLLVGVVFFSGCTGRNNAGLQVLSNDIPSSVYLDGKYVEKTPYIQKELKAGDYSVEIRPDDTTFVPYQTKVSLKKGMLTVISWKPGKRPETSGGVVFETEALQNNKATELIITTIPDGGIIYVDGVAKGFAPVTVQDLSPGEHQFEVKLPSYEPQTHPINMLEGYRILVTAKLGKQDYQSPRPQATTSATPLPSVTTSPSPSASPSTSASPSPKLSPSPAATTSAKPSPSVAPVTGQIAPPKVVILKTNYFKDGVEVLRVRNGASPDATEIGVAPVGSEYTYLGEVKDGWAKMSFGQTPGWVSKQFVNVVE